MPASKPVIGLTCEYDLKKNLRAVSSVYPDYYECVEAAGGIPLLIPHLRDRKDMRALLDRIDGVILTGGDDYNPHLYGEEPHHTYVEMFPRRERFDLEFASILLESGIPLFGICGGIQLLNLVLGGTLLQDIDRQVPESLVHTMAAPDIAVHEVQLEPDSLLNPTAVRSSCEVPSYHHQAVAELGPGLRVIGRSRDGVIEAVQGEGTRFLLAVQWHPEKALAYQGPMREFHIGQFQLLVEAAREYRWPKEGTRG